MKVARYIPFLLCIPLNSMAQDRVQLVPTGQVQQAFGIMQVAEDEDSVTMLTPPSIDTTNRAGCRATRVIKKIQTGIMCVWSDSGAVDPGCRINLTKELGEQGGGHGHTGGDRPLGTLSRTTGLGQFDFDYEAPEVSGIVNVVATGADSFGNAIAPYTFKMKVQTNGMVPLPPSADYRFIGNAGTHTERFWGTAELVAAVASLARDYHALFADHTLGYNDMNLPLGGLFDLNDDWTEPHCGHRGNSADLRTTDVPMGRRRDLRRLIVVENGLALHDETQTAHPHFHLTR